jgi:proline dehydrogenase
MPGESVEEALAAAEAYAGDGIGAVFTLLGENLTSFAEAERVARDYEELLAEVARRGLRAEVSVKLTQLGLDIDTAGTERLVRQLAVRAADAAGWLWIDMEGSAYVQATVDLYETVLRDHSNVGLCIQAYLHRTPADVERLLPLRPGFRLVKGAYDEPAAIAYRSKHEVDATYAAIAGQLVDGLAAGTIARAILATHDVALITAAMRLAEAAGLPRTALEIQMLYGIRADEQRRLATEGYDVRGLVAYGSHWYAWYMRRLAERPANVIFALRQLLP